MGTHYVTLYVQNNDASYFDFFGAEHIPKQTKAFINRLLSSALQNKNIKTNIFRIQAYDSIMRGYFYMEFIDFVLAKKILTEYINLFSPNNFKKNDDIIFNNFMSNIQKWMILIKHQIIIQIWMQFH